LFPGEAQFPFVMADNWQNALQIVNKDLAKGLVSSRQKRCQLFWAKWKSIWKYQIHVKLSLLGV
jgi:hypothetical protein